MRKINSYVLLHKKEGPYRNVKEFKQYTLNKILAVAERKYENKINLRRSGVDNDARGMTLLMQKLKNYLSISRAMKILCRHQKDIRYLRIQLSAYWSLIETVSVAKANVKTQRMMILKRLFRLLLFLMRN